MNEHILDHIPFSLDREELLKRLRIPISSPYARDLNALADEAETIARPKAMYKITFVETKGDDFVVIDGTILVSKVLRINLEEAHRVFPYLATCGMELEKWASQFDDLLMRFWADTIMEMALYPACRALDEHIEQTYQPGKRSTMNPGSLEDWPLTQQKGLFSILGDTEGLVGVQLTESCLMIPPKSISGIQFPTQEEFASCQLCPREICPNRRASYDPALRGRKYR